MHNSLNDRAVQYHEALPHGKLSVQPTKALSTVDDLALAYTPGVAEPVRRIAKTPDDAYLYTDKGNLVAVISNGTAVLGLGNQGALASKPVMEGKAVLFKRFAGIDAFDIEINSEDPAEIIRTVELLEPTFGGINLEDFKAPECMVIERELIKRMQIPVMHDDQHGTAVVVSAGILNALTVANKTLKDVTIVLNGAGSAGLAVATMLKLLGCNPERLFLCDSKGVLTEERSDLGEFKQPFARKTAQKMLKEILRGADVFIGVSKANVLDAEMLRSMAAQPIVFALANPDPEIDPALAKATREDVILATGRSDFPNQINNVLCFPFLFRGALDARALQINDVMKMAAAHALAALAREAVPPAVLQAYGLPSLSFGRGYLLPKPFDRRLLPTVSSAVAQAAMESGTARVTLDLKEYRVMLEKKSAQNVAQ